MASEGPFSLVGFPSTPGTQLIKASAKFKVPKVPRASKPLRKRQQLGTPPVARGNTVTGASMSTSRIGY